MNKSTLLLEQQLVSRHRGIPSSLVPSASLHQSVFLLQVLRPGQQHHGGGLEGIGRRRL